MDQLSPGLRAGLAIGRYDFHPTHSLGQNFIMDEQFLNHLLDLANIDQTDNVLEIGPGPGIMTCLIADRVKAILAIEADQRLEPVLKDVLSDRANAGFVIADALKCDIDAMTDWRFEGPYRVIANLPYYITADLILKMLSVKNLPDNICVMVQKEAAERLMSSPGDKNWGAFAATVRYFCDCIVLEDVPPSRFDPAPHVDSCFIRLDLQPDRLIAREYEPALVRLIRACFAMRRKTLANNLKASYGVDLAKAAELITAAGLGEKVRGEVLTIEQIAKLFGVMREANVIK